MVLRLRDGQLTTHVLCVKCLEELYFEPCEDYSLGKQPLQGRAVFPATSSLMASSWHLMSSFAARSPSSVITSIRASSAMWATSTNLQARSGCSVRIWRISGTASSSPFSARRRRSCSFSTVFSDSSSSPLLIADILSGAGESPADCHLSSLFLGLTFSSPFSSLVSSVSGSQKRCSIQGLRGFAQILYRGHECFELLAL